MDSLSHAEKAVETAVQSLFGRVAHWAHAHPRRLAAGTAAVLAVFAGTAFGLAPMAPDASALPKRLITESFTPDNLDAQLDALAAQHLVLARSDVTRANDTADTLTKRLGIVRRPSSTPSCRPTPRRASCGRAAPASWCRPPPTTTAS